MAWNSLALVVDSLRILLSVESSYLEKILILVYIGIGIAILQLGGRFKRFIFQYKNCVLIAQEFYKLGKDITFRVVYVSSLLCSITVWALFFAACLITSLQIIFVFERGFEFIDSTFQEYSKEIKYYHIFQVICLPHLFILWSFISTSILSRQSDIVYFIFSTPYNTIDDVTNAQSSFGHLVLSNHATANIAPSLQSHGRRATQLAILLITSLWITSWYFVVSLEIKILLTVLSIALFFLIYHLYNDSFITRMYWYETTFVILALTLSSLWMIIPYDIVVGEYNKLITVFLGLATCLCIVIQFFELWCLPAIMLFLSDADGNIIQARTYWFYLIDLYLFIPDFIIRLIFSVRATSMFSYVCQVLDMDEKNAYLINALKFFVGFSGTVLTFLFSSMILHSSSHHIDITSEMNSAEMQAFMSTMRWDFFFRCTLEFVITAVLFSCLFVFCCTHIVSKLFRYFFPDKQKQPLTDEIIKFNKKQQEEVDLAFRFTYTVYYLIFVTVMMVVQLAVVKGKWEIAFWNWLYFSIGWYLLYFVYAKPMFEIFYIIIFLSIYFYLVRNESVIYFALLITHGFTLFRQYAILYTKSPLPLPLDIPVPTEYSKNGKQCDMNAYYMDIDYFFMNRIRGMTNIYSTWERENKIPGQQGNNASTSGRFRSGTQLPSNFVNDKCVKYKGTHRFYNSIFGILFGLHVVLYLLTTWSQHEKMYPRATTCKLSDKKFMQLDRFGNGINTRTISKIKKADIARSKHSHHKYPICHDSYYSLNIIDVAYLTEMTYLQDPVYNDAECSDGKEVLENFIQRYFTPNYTKAELNYQPYNWNVTHLNVSNRHDSQQDVTYYIMHSQTARLVVIGVRGSSTGRDWLEDFGLYPEISALQVISRVVPLVYLWSPEIVSKYVKIMNYVSSLSLLKRNPRLYVSGGEISNYYNEIVMEIHRIKQNTYYEGYNILLIGHSLGGATAGIAGAKTNTLSVGFEPPGMVYSKDKFGIAGNTQRIHETSITIIREHDPVTMVDIHGGQSQHITCPTTQLDFYCHLMHPITCHLLSNCYNMNFSHPEVFDSWGGAEKYCTTEE